MPNRVRISKKKPGNAKLQAARRARIEQALSQGDIEGAASLAEVALAAGQEEPMLLNLAACSFALPGFFEILTRFDMTARLAIHVPRRKRERRTSDAVRLCNAPELLWIGHGSG